MSISREQFEKIVDEAIADLPEKFKNKMHNVVITVEEWPTPAQLKRLGIKSRYALFGLYEGYHQASRRNVGPVLPDRITIFRMPIVSSCRTADACHRQIISTVKHEIAHHFGSDEHGARKASNRKA
jgi:predicted Zn-dependent protease with MMP-like domain